MSREKYAPKRDPRSLQRWSPAVAFTVFLVAVLFLLMLEHRAHVAQALPYILIGVCVAAFLMLLWVARKDRTAPGQRVAGKEVNAHDR